MENKGFWIGGIVLALVAGLIAGFLVGKKQKTTAKKITPPDKKSTPKEPEKTTPTTENKGDANPTKTT